VTVMSTAVAAHIGICRGALDKAPGAG